MELEKVAEIVDELATDRIPGVGLPVIVSCPICKFQDGPDESKQEDHWVYITRFMKHLTTFHHLDDKHYMKKVNEKIDRWYDFQHANM